MKKNLFLSSLALAAAFTVSCNKENVEGDGIATDGEAALFPAPSVINASSEATKTTLDNTSILWAAGDAVTLFSEDGAPVKYVLDGNGGETTGTFSVDGEVPAQVKGYAVYPATENSLTAENTVAVNIAENQTYVADGFPTDYPMAAVTENGTDFTFENLATVLRISLTGVADIKSISVEAEGIAGNTNVDFSNLSLSKGSASSVTLTFPKENENSDIGFISLHEGENEFNFIVIPGTYSELKFTIIETNNTTTVKTASLADGDIVLNAGAIADFDVAIEIDTPKGWNIFGTITGVDNTYIDLQGGHGTYFCSNVIASENQNKFNIRYAGDANQIFGIGYGQDQDTNVPEMIPYNTYQGQDGTLNLTPSEKGYDIYFIEDTKKLIVTETGTAAFSVIGNINGTSFGTDFPMIVENGWLVAKGIEFTGNTFKIRTTGSWSTNEQNYYYNIGAGECVVGNPCNVWSYVGTTDMTVTGTETGKKYDIYLDMKRHDPNNSADNMTVWVMPEGQVPGQSAE